jgi:hypothetical protein
MAPQLLSGQPALATPLAGVSVWVLLAPAAFVLLAVIFLGLLERGYAAAMLRRRRSPEAYRRTRLSWRVFVATYLLLFLFVALARDALLGRLPPSAEVVMYGALSIPLIIAFLVYSNQSD